MAQVILVAYGSSGDVNPFLGLGAALKQRGHLPTLVANEHFRRQAAAAGIAFEPMGSQAQYVETMRHPDFWNPRAGFATLARYACEPVVEGLDRIRARYVPGDTVLVGSRYAFAALLARDQLGVPMATLMVNLTSLRSVHAPAAFAGVQFPEGMEPSIYGLLFQAVERKLNEHLARPLNDCRAAAGLPPIDDLIAWWNSPDLLMAAWPSWVYERQPDWPAHAVTTGFVEYDGEGSSADGLSGGAADDRPIVFTAGTAMLQGAEFYRAAAAACAALKRPGILLTQYSEQLPATLPPGVRHVDYVPLAAILPAAAAIVHHGGIGTCARALRAGIPQVVVPMAHDQFENARRMAQLGVAGVVARDAAAPETLALALTAVLRSQAVAERCRHRAGQMQDNDGLRAACTLIERMSPQAVRVSLSHEVNDVRTEL